MIPMTALSLPIYYLLLGPYSLPQVCFSLSPHINSLLCSSNFVATSAHITFPEICIKPLSSFFHKTAFWEFVSFTKTSWADPLD